MSVPEDYPDADRVIEALQAVKDAYDEAAEVCEEEALTLLGNTLTAHGDMVHRITESVRRAKRADTDVHFNVDESAIPEGEL